MILFMFFFKGNDAIDIQTRKGEVFFLHYQLFLFQYNMSYQIEDSQEQSYGSSI